MKKIILVAVLGCAALAGLLALMEILAKGTVESGALQYYFAGLITIVAFYTIATTALDKWATKNGVRL